MGGKQQLSVENSQYQTVGTTARAGEGGVCGVGSGEETREREWLPSAEGAGEVSGNRPVRQSRKFNVAILSEGQGGDPVTFGKKKPKFPLPAASRMDSVFF